MTTPARTLPTKPSSMAVTPLYYEIGKRIRRERDELGFSQGDVAAEIGLLRTSVANIESGRQRLPIHVLYAIADALGVSVFCLLPNNLRERG